MSHQYILVQVMQLEPIVSWGVKETFQVMLIGNNFVARSPFREPTGGKIESKFSAENQFGSTKSLRVLLVSSKRKVIDSITIDNYEYNRANTLKARFGGFRISVLPLRSGRRITNAVRCSFAPFSSQVFLEGCVRRLLRFTMHEIRGLTKTKRTAKIYSPVVIVTLGKQVARVELSKSALPSVKRTVLFSLDGIDATSQLKVVFARRGLLRDIRWGDLVLTADLLKDNATVFPAIAVSEAHDQALARSSEPNIGILSHGKSSGKFGIVYECKIVEYEARKTRNNYDDDNDDDDDDESESESESEEERDGVIVKKKSRRGRHHKKHHHRHRKREKKQEKEDKNNDDENNNNNEKENEKENVLEEEVELTPPPFIPNLSELSEFARSFYASGGVHAEEATEDEELRAAKEKAQNEEEERRSALLRRARRKLSASGMILLADEDLMDDDDDDGDNDDDDDDDDDANAKNSLKLPKVALPNVALPPSKTNARISSSRESDITFVVPKMAEVLRSEQSVVNEWNRCNACNTRPPTLDDAFTQDSCAHRVCTECVLSQVVLSAPEESVQCPVKGCHDVCSNRILRLLLPSKEFDMRLDAELALALAAAAESDDTRIVRCPVAECGFLCEASDAGEPTIDGAGSGAVAARADDEAPSVEGIELFRQAHRFRCRKCFVDFCDECNKTPFHDGHTCASLAAWERAPKCRFCGEPALRGDATASGAHSVACDAAECQKRLHQSCQTVHEACGHACGGLRFESAHLPCLEEECAAGAEARSAGGVHQTAQDFCNICWVEPLSAAPAIVLECSHVFHLACAKKRIEERWNGARIAFGFLTCPLCQEPMTHRALGRFARGAVKLRAQIESMAMKRLEYENLQKHDDIVSGRFKDNARGFAMNRYAYYECFQCKLPYFGGQADCQGGPGENENGELDLKLLVCSACRGSASPGATNCDKHGKDFIEYKCRYCCSVASWFCWGTTRLCEQCHITQGSDYEGIKMTRQPKHLFPEHWVFNDDQMGSAEEWPAYVRPSCPLKIEHPKNGTDNADISLGCALCRQEKEF